MGNDGPDQRRRRILAQLALVGSGVYIAPTVIGLGGARASEASGGSGASGPAAGSGPSRPIVRQQTRRGRPMPSPEVVAILPSGTQRDVLTSAGYRVLGQAAIAGGDIFRLGLPPARTVVSAQQELAFLIPGIIADANTLYSPNELLCADGDCLSHRMIGWSGWPNAFAPRIGMIDTGINTDHDALTGQRLIVTQADLGDRAAASRQHGTAIAALLIGRLESRVPGLLPLAELHAVEAFHSVEGNEAADAFALAQALDTLIAARVSVINMSFSGPENAVLRMLVSRAHAAGIGLVAAAGNNGPGADPVYPAAWPEVIAVTAIDADQRPYRQANRGAYVTFAAPGVNLWTAASIAGGRLRSGTSYAAPFVTATLAVERERSPDLPLADQVQALIGCARDLGDAGFDNTFGHGLVSAPDQCLATDAAAGSDKFLTSGE